ncbi:MAG: serine/threonine-protein kinase [Polyangiaceae bacterium]
MSAPESLTDGTELPAAPPTVSVGEVIHGKYKVERVIGEGGMGLVVAARHMTLDRSVALKLLNNRSRESQEALERFTREARAAARIQSEHVGRVLDVDAMPNGAPFIVMELLDGHDLSHVLATEKKVPVDRAVAFVIQACEAVAEAHAAGIVHRDLKPANLFLARTAASTGGATTIKVLDFGISKITRQDTDASITANKALTNPAAMLGSPLYMSPEQMKASTEVDARTDIWSLGVILYELVAGVSPFDGKTIPMICASVLSQPPPPITDPAIPQALVSVITRCLEKEPGKRYRDIAHLVRALAPFAPEQAKITIERINKLRDDQGKPAASPATVPPPGMHNREGSLTITSWDAKQPPAAKRKWVPIAVVGVLALAVGGFVLSRVVAPSPTASPEPSNAVAATGTSDPTSAPAATTVKTTTAVSSASSPSTTPEVSSSPVTQSSSVAVATTSGASTARGPATTTHPTTIKPRTSATTGKRTEGFGGRE